MVTDEQGASWALDLAVDTVMGGSKDVACACNTGVLGVVGVARVVAGVF